MDSAKRLHSVKSKKRELRGAQRASRQKIEEIRKVTKFFSLFSRGSDLTTTNVCPLVSQSVTNL